MGSIYTNPKEYEEDKMKVRVGSLYAYKPVGFDLFDPCTNLTDGEIVRVINLHGCPRANTMGHCHVAYPDALAGDFIGLVLCNSLIPVKREGKKYYLNEG